MRDPYEVLGVARTASTDEIKAAYRSLAKKYHPDNYTDSPLADVANEKMQEINEAYDAIMNGTAGSAAGSRRSYTDQRSGGAPDYDRIRSFIWNGQLDEAEQMLETIDGSFRGAEWYYWKGQVNYRRGWLDQAYTYFTTAYNMEPENSDYRRMYETLQQQRNGGFRTARGDDSGLGACSLCQGLLCADCCCECFGGDLIPCC